MSDKSMGFEDLASLITVVSGAADLDVPAFTARKYLESNTLIVLSNRIPFSVASGHPRRSVSGLVSSVEAALEEGPSATWLGWNGSYDNTGRWFYRERNGQLTVIGIPIRQDYVASYYMRVCNSYLLPIYTGSWDWSEDISDDDWEAYVGVNAMFAHEACRIADRGAIVWVNDFHLQLCPQLIKDERPDLSVVYYHHVPFPSPSLFGRIRQHVDILNGIAGADRIGLQTFRDKSNLLAYGSHLFDNAGSADQETINDTRDFGIRSTVVVSPAEIDTLRWRRFRDDPVTLARAAHLRALLGSPDHIFLGVDRLDPIKGIPDKIQAFAEAERRLGANRERRIILLQVAVAPDSRSLIDDNHIRDALSYMPTPSGGQASIYMTTEELSPDQLAILYETADALVVTSLSEGMNLVVKEFVAVRGWDPNKLVISRFAGVAEDLPSAVLIDPSNIDGVASALMRTMGSGKKSEEEEGESLPPRFVARSAVVWMHEVLGELGNIDV